MSVHVVRRARVEDHDELVPLLAAGQAACPSLATLPETCLPDQPFALTRLISSQVRAARRLLMCSCSLLTLGLSAVCGAVVQPRQRWSTVLQPAMGIA